MVKNISVIFPYYNEGKNIAKQISYSNSILNKIIDDYEIIIINDENTDESKILLERIASENNKIKIISHRSNLGYGKAFQNEFKQTTKNLVFYISLDNQYDISQINNFLLHIVHNDIVIDYRIKRKDPLYRILISRLYNFLVRTLYGLKLRDINCAFKLFKKNSIFHLEIKSNHFFVDTEILLRAIKLGQSIKQLEVQHYPRTLDSSTVNHKRMVLTLIEVIEFWKDLHL